MDASLGRKSRAMLCGAIGVLALSEAFAAEYRTIGAEPAVLYDAPTLRGRKVWIAPAGMPVDVVFTEGEWVRVRDASGDLSWVQKKSLGESGGAVTRSSAAIRTAPDVNAPVVAGVAPGVLLKIVEPPTRGWVKVRHRDGASGYLRSSEIFGG